MREFAGFLPAEQRYIKCSLLVAKNEAGEAEQLARDTMEKAAIRAQAKVYERIPTIRDLIPKTASLGDVDDLIGPLVLMSGFDLNRGRLSSFSPYRFLYERLFGARVREWLVSSFSSASALPYIEPKRRKTLLQSISEEAAMAPGWSRREPFFFPEWVEKEVC